MTVLYNSGNYSTSSLIAGGDGTLYFTNDSGKLYALSSRGLFYADPVTDREEQTGVTLDTDTGVVPAGTKLKIGAVASGAKFQLASAALSGVAGRFTLFDIKLTDADGNAVQPEGKVRIGIPVPEGFDKTRLAVYRIDPDGTRTEYAVTVEGDMAYFETDHFSLYGLAEKAANGGGETPTEEGTTGSGTDPNSSAGGTAARTNSRIPRTGDTREIGPYLVLLFAAGAAIVLSMIYRRRKNPGDRS